MRLKNRCSQSGPLIRETRLRNVEHVNESGAARPQCRAVEIKPTMWLGVCSNQPARLHRNYRRRLPSRHKQVPPTPSGGLPSNHARTRMNRAVDGSPCGGRAATVQKGSEYSWSLDLPQAAQAGPHPPLYLRSPTLRQRCKLGNLSTFSYGGVERGH